MVDPGGELDDVIEEMEEAAAEVSTGEITTATRDVELDGVQVQAGQILGLADGKICCADLDIDTVFQETLSKMGIKECELLTVYFGEGTTAQEAEGMAEKAIEWYPHVEVEVVDGGQPHYFYIVSAE
jgi:hypothetical protein